ncbi:DUF697 domain-containing protein [Thiorhodococcus fuscus]|uniref:DUF697 domain-containing protein n=1 Tax=Thiorhodococcus fuscus TaxID=527200 RepID=A0ABW4YBM0_9GAMM
MVTAANPTTEDVQAETPENVSHQDRVSKIISSSVSWSAAAAVVPVPYLDLLAIGAVQVEMVRRLAAAYGEDADKETLKGLISALLGTLAPAAISASLLGSSLKVIPMSGTLLGSAGLAAFAAAATYAIGKIFVRHFEGGGSIGDFSVDAVKDDLKKEFDSAKSK